MFHFYKAQEHKELILGAEVLSVLSELKPSCTKRSRPTIPTGRNIPQCNHGALGNGLRRVLSSFCQISVSYIVNVKYQSQLPMAHL